MEIFVLIQINLRSIPKGRQNLRKWRAKKASVRWPHKRFHLIPALYLHQQFNLLAQSTNALAHLSEKAYHVPRKILIKLALILEPGTFET